MFTLIGQGGLYGMLLAVLILIAAVYFVLSVTNLVRYKKEDYAKINENINTIVRIGVLSAALGFLGTIYGGYLAMIEILKASDISMQIVWNGLICALSTTVLGFHVFVVTAIVWFILRNILRRLG